MKSYIYKPACVLIITTLFTLTALAELNFEAAQTLQASKILPPGLIKGPHHQVDERVVNDAYLNIYTIHSEFGDVQAVSTAKLWKYIDEINAVAEMKKIQGSDEFAKALVEIQSKAKRKTFCEILYVLIVRILLSSIIRFYCTV